MFYLKELRLENGLKRSELAKLTGIHQQTLANYENETRQAPYEVLLQLADFFEVSVDDLLGRENMEYTKEKNDALLSPKDRSVLRQYRELSEEDKKRLEDYLSLLHLAEKIRKGQ